MEIKKSLTNLFYNTEPYVGLVHYLLEIDE